MKIKLYAHPLAPCAPQVFEVDNLAQWLLDHYGDVPQVKVQVFAGDPSAETEITSNFAALMANDCAEYTVLQSPGFEGIAYVIAAVLIVAAIALAPKPSMPGNVNRTQQSPNNSLGNRENKLRFLERVEDIYGTVKAIPSLMMPTYYKYINHRKYEYGYYCVGRGYYDIADAKDADTPIAEIDNASASFYNPFTSPNSGHAPFLQIGDAIIDDIVTVTRSVEVDGVTLKAHNQVQLPDSEQYTYTPDAGGDIITQKRKIPNFNAVLAVGDTITVTMDNYTPESITDADLHSLASDNSFNNDSGTAFVHVEAGDTILVSGFDTPYLNDSFTVTSKPSTKKIIVSGSTLIDEFTSGIASIATTSKTVNYSGNYTIAEVNDGSIRVSSTLWTVAIPWDKYPSSSGTIFETPINSTILIDNVTNYTDWSILPSVDRTEVWVNVIAPNGMFYDDGGKSTATVAFSIEIERLDSNLNPLGLVEIVNSTLSGVVTDERADTVEHTTSWTGPARVRMRRTSNYDYGFQGTVMDEIKWGDLYSVAPVSKTEFGNKTTVHTITQATSRATAAKSRQLNCIASRKLPTYNGSTFSGAFDADGRHVSGTIAATSKLVDIIAAVSVDPKIGQRDLATEVDMAQMWSVQQALDAWNVKAGQFNYTFDTDNMSFEETVVSIANAGFCIAYRQNGKLRLAFDRAQANSTALFTHRNKKPNAESITRRFASDSEYDGVEFVYVDPETSQSETITLPLDGNFTKLKKFEIAGIRSYEQAWLRANREYHKLLGQRITIETGTTSDARALLPNARVDIVDNTRFKSYDGEVVGQDGMEITLSRDVQFIPSVPHSIVLMRRDGSLQSIAVTPGSEPSKVILQSLPSEAIVTQYGIEGIRTIFSFAADSARGAMAYLVQEIDLSDPQYATIRAINYSDSYYQMDYQPIPAKQTVIN